MFSLSLGCHMILSLIYIFTFYCQTTTSESNATITCHNTGKLVPDIWKNYVYTEFGAYKIHKYGAKWNEASKVCKSEEADLVVIDSEPEEAMVTKYMQTTSIHWLWLGCKYNAVVKNWITMKGKPLIYEHWSHYAVQYESTCGICNCLAMTNDGMYHNSCKTINYFMCEKNDSP